MTTTVTHPYVSAVADGGNTNLVQPSNWNANHTVTADYDEPLQGQDLSLYGSQNLTMQSKTNLLYAAATLLAATANYELNGSVPNTNYRLHYRDGRVTGLNNVTLEGSGELVVLDLAPGSNLSLRGVG